MSKDLGLTPDEAGSLHVPGPSVLWQPPTDQEALRHHWAVFQGLSNLKDPVGP